MTVADTDRRAPCVDCGRLSLQAGDAKYKGRCFDCHGKVCPNPYAGIHLSASAEGEDSEDPRRKRDGTAIFNIGLPPVETDIGKRKNGKRALHTRPISNNELPTRRKREDYAKRHGLVPWGDAPKRAIGGR